ncbi:hypothetical protein PG985_006077 [Apiospora marii]|uniref:uncharacterized protein n=1 Tax=Apiospora marii TaxID=335849 RepID=UPI00312FF13C
MATSQRTLTYASSVLARVVVFLCRFCAGEIMANLMSQACERCWRRKQKCDRRRPMCQQCQLVSATCFERRHGLVVDPSDPASQLSYIEALKRRVQLLEAQAGQASPQQSRDESTSPASDARAGSERRASRSSGSRAVGCRDSIQNEMGSLSLAAMAEFTGEQSSLPRPRPFLSFETLFRSATGVAAGNLSRSDAPNPAANGALGDFHRTLLRQGLQLNSIETKNPFNAYLDISVQCFPFVERNQLVEEYATISQADPGAFDALLADSPGRVVRVYVAVATGILLSPDWRHLETFATALALAAHQHIPRVDESAGELETVQCLIATALFSLFTSLGGSTWHLLGLALSRCVSAGMHRIRVSDAQSDDEEKRGCSRAFWCLYVFDTLISASLDRPFFYPYATPVDAKNLPHQPPSQSSDSSDEFDIFHRSVVQCARLLRDAQQKPVKGALFHFINLRHFRETMPRYSTGFDNGSWMLDNLCSRFCCRTLLEIVSHLTPAQSGTETAMVVEYTEEQFAGFLEILDQNPETQKSCAFMGCDGLLVFRIGVELLCNPLFGKKAGANQPNLTVSQKCLRLLVTVSEKFSSVRCLREILEQLVVCLATGSRHTHADWLSLERRIESSEIPIPRRVQDLIYSLRISTPSSRISS